MPRLDNSDPHILATVNGFRGDRDKKPIIFFASDPGMTPPVDVCYWDWVEIFEQRGGDVEHPPYEEGDEAFCVICGDSLGSSDD